MVQPFRGKPGHLRIVIDNPSADNVDGKPLISAG